MKELNFPLLTKEQIEVRVGQVTAKGCSLLLYKTARTDAEILDKIVGAGNWQKKFYTLQGVGMGDKERSIVVCSVGIYDDDKHEWVWKDDSGAESQVEQDKGVCSDAFKRASGGSCWGIGRELYYTGFLFAKVETKKKESGRGYELADEYLRFEVKSIEWNEKPLSLKKLVIVDSDGNVVLSKGVYDKASQNGEKEPKNTNAATKEQPQQAITFPNEPIGSIEPHDLTLLQNYADLLPSEESKSKFYSWLDKHFKTMALAKLTKSQAKVVVKKLGIE